MTFSKTKAYYVVLITLCMLGCNDDFLTKAPLDEVSSETFWNTENDLRVYNNSFYDMTLDNGNVPILMGHWTDKGIWSLDGFTDNMAPIHDRHIQYQQIRAGGHNITTNPRDYGYAGWDFVRAVNVGLVNYNNADIPQVIINRYIAEARLFRGWFYANKVQRFGDVPWIDEPLNIDSEELYAARTSRDEAMEFVLADLQYASENLPADWGDGEPGRLNKWAALLVKSRVALFEGTWQKYHDGQNAEVWLEIATEAAKEIIDNGPYSIYNTGDINNDYNSFHRVLDLSGNPEVIYWKKYQEGVNTNHALGYFHFKGGATKSLVEDYLCTDGLPITLSPLYQGDDQIENVFENRDPRLRQSILHPDDTAKYRYHEEDGRSYPRVTGMTGGFISSTGYHVIKNYNADDLIGKAHNTGEAPAIVMRFGEVLLNYAEAKAELGNITQQDLDISINKLRERVGMPRMILNDIPVDPRYLNDGVPPLIVEIRRERRIELFLEGHRYNDLMRWRQGRKLENPDLGIRWNNEAINRYQGANVQVFIDPESGYEYIDVYKGTDWENPVFDENRHYLWPIPISALSQNPEIGQNPGW